MEEQGIARLIIEDAISGLLLCRQRLDWEANVRRINDSGSIGERKEIVGQVSSFRFSLLLTVGNVTDEASTACCTFSNCSCLLPSQIVLNTENLYRLLTNIYLLTISGKEAL